MTNNEIKVSMTLEQTIEECTKTIQQDPNNAKAYYDRGLLQYFNKNYTEALSALRIDRDSMPAEVDYAIEDMGTWPKGDN
jgi:tetratricopeptide (TPR) repeat protein